VIALLCVCVCVCVCVCISIYIYIYIYIDDIISIIKENRQVPVVRNQPIPALLLADVLEMWLFTNSGLQQRPAQTVKYGSDGI
jgi:hypothetical protein